MSSRWLAVGGILVALTLGTAVWADEPIATPTRALGPAGAVLAAGTATPTAAPAAPPRPISNAAPTTAPAPSAEVVRLIAQLGDEQWQKREEAQKKLAQLADPTVLPALRQAAENPLAEIAIRAQLLLADLMNFTHVVVDAQGRPIPNAAISLVYSDGRKTLELATNGFGGVNLPDEQSPLVARQNRELRFAHPKYGQTAGRLPWRTPAPAVPAGQPGQPGNPGNPRMEATEIRVPLVEQGTDAYERALKGVVLDPEGQPVPGVRITCSSVRSPGEGLIQFGQELPDIVTDAKGRFSVYMPDPNRRNERGRLIPVNSNYYLSITAQEAGLFPYAVTLPNTTEATIRLQRPELFHKFEFEAPAAAPGGGSRRLGPKELAYVSLSYELTDGGRVGLDRSYVMDGGKLLPGRYTARLTVHGETRYLPLEVTKDSPETLLFRLPPPVKFRGRIVDGPSGKPLPGAFVIGHASIFADNPAVLTDEQWRVLEGLAAKPALEDRALADLKQVYVFGAILRADDKGAYEMVQPADRKFYNLVAFARDRLPYTARVLESNPDPEQVVAVADMPLFPAAKIVIKPVVVASPRHVSAMPRWELGKDGQPDWIGNFKKALGDMRSDSKIYYQQELKLNQAQAIYVPADVKLKLWLVLPSDDEFAPTVNDKPIQLGVGQILDIGEMKFGPALVVKVRVVDETGKGIEGAPVRRMYQGQNVWSVVHNADENGLVQFHVNPNSSGRFGIHDGLSREERSGPHAPEVAFTVDSTAPNQPLTITLTPQQVRSLQRAPARLKP